MRTRRSKFFRDEFGSGDVYIVAGITLSLVKGLDK